VVILSRTSSTILNTSGEGRQEAFSLSSVCLMSICRLFLVDVLYLFC
jgi:hypothetical protein